MHPLPPHRGVDRSNLAAAGILPLSCRTVNLTVLTVFAFNIKGVES